MLFFLGPVLVTLVFAHAAAVLALAFFPKLPRRYAAIPVLIGSSFGIVEVHAGDTVAGERPARGGPAGGSEVGGMIVL